MVQELKYTESVIKALKDNEFGWSIQELANIIKCDRAQIRLVLAELEGAKKVVVRQVGNAKVYRYVNGGLIKKDE